MTVSRTVDVDLIKTVMLHPAIFPLITEDGSPSADVWTPPMDGFIYLTDSVGSGIIAMHWWNGVTIEAHVQVLPEMRNHARSFVIDALDWVRRETEARKIVSMIPTLYPNVRDFCLSFGFEMHGVCTKSHLKGGVLHDQWILGLEI